MNKGKVTYTERQGKCPQCGQDVGITKRGTIAIHSRLICSIMGRWSKRKCSASATSAPTTMYAEWLAEKRSGALDAREYTEAQITRIRADLAGRESELAGLNERIARIDEATRALGDMGGAR